jgi:dihydroorotase
VTAELTLRNGTLALPTGRVQADLQIGDGKITAIGVVKEDRGEVFDASHLLVMPGVIDPQVHFREPGLTHKEDLHSGSRACAVGGVTSYLEMPNTNPPTIDPEALAFKKQRASLTSIVNYGFFIGATPDNVDVLNSVEQVPGIKIFMGSSTGSLLVSEPEALERIFSNGTRLIAVHAEDEARLRERQQRYAGVTDPKLHSEIRDVQAALLASQLAIELSDRHQRRLHILHLSTGDEAELLRRHGKGSGRISCEVTPQHLLLNAPEIYERLGTRAQMNPPLRTKDHSDRLWAALHDGVIDCIATDHAPHTLDEKGKAYGAAPSGMPGVETALPVMLDAAHEGRCSVEQVVRWMCEAPARLYRMKNKGRLAVGFDADLVLVDLARRERVGERGYQTRVAWSPFEGMRLVGWPIATIVGGRFAYRDGAVDTNVRGRAIEFMD